MAKLETHGDLHKHNLQTIIDEASLPEMFDQTERMIEIMTMIINDDNYLVAMLMTIGMCCAWDTHLHSKMEAHIDKARLVFIMGKLLGSDIEMR